MLKYLLKNTNRYLCLSAAALLAVFLLLFSGCTESRDWVMFRGEGGRGWTPEKIYPPVGIKWKLKLQEGSARERHFNPPVVYNDTLYFGSSDSNFYALDIKTGYMRWVYKTRAPVNSVPFVDSEKVYFGSTDGFIYAVHTDSGELAWEKYTEYPVNSTIIGYENSIVFTTDTGATHFMTKDGIETDVVPNFLWQYNSFQIYNDVVYFLPGPIENPYSLGAYSITEKDFLWVFPTGDDGLYWYSFPAVSSGKVLFSAAGLMENMFFFKYYALDEKTGDIIWENMEISDPVDFDDYTAFDILWENIYLLDYMAPAVWGKNVIYSPGDSTVKSLKIETGDLAWEKKFTAYVSSAPTIADSRIYLGIRGSIYNDTAPSFVCLNAKDGKLLWDIDVEGDILGSPVIAGRWIIFGTSENYLYVLEELF